MRDRDGQHRGGSKLSRIAPALVLLAALGTAGLSAQEGPPPALGMEVPAVVLSGVETRLEVRTLEPLEAPLSVEATWVPEAGEVVLAGPISLGPGMAEETLSLLIPRSGKGTLFVSADGWETEQEVRCLPAWLSLLPPLLAIGLALAVRSVIPALFAGIWVGATLVAGLNPWSGLLRTLDTYLLEALADPDHASIVIFSLMLGGMVGVMSRCGGTAGIVEALAPLARTRRSGQLATWAMGLLVFFDDYANSLIVGNTMRPVTDRLRISREKLAYLVDSTAAPVASLAVISTWIGYEVGLIGDAFAAAGYDGNAYLAFLASIPYRYYPLLALWMVLLVGLTGRDLGAMARAEERAARTGELLHPEAQPLADTQARDMTPLEGVQARWWNAVVPIVVVILASFIGLWVTGRAATGPEAALREVFGQADPFRSLLWGSLLGVLAALVLAVGQRLLSLTQALDAWLGGVKAMTLAVVVLLLAWGIGQVTTEDLHAADYLSGLITEALDPRLLPALTFLLAAGISFSTGTSWGTMGILMPLVVPAALNLSGPVVGEVPGPLVLGTLSSVLAGAVFGDHCSPISDTTVLSSMASACDHVDHVRTQFPYALLAGATGLFLGDLMTSFVPVPGGPWIALVLGAGFLAFWLWWKGTSPGPPEDPSDAEEAPAETPSTE